MAAAKSRDEAPRPRAQDIDRYVGARMRERRLMLGLTQQHLADLIGVTYQQAHKYEKGVNRIAAGRLSTIARALGVPLAALMLWEGPPAYEGWGTVDPDRPPVGSVDFSVEDFVPEKLKVELSSNQPIVRPGQVNTFDVQADFLYGAPGSGLTVEADMRITVDAQPFPDFTRYSFGAQEDRKAFEPPFLTLKAPDTDERGKTRLEWGGDIKDKGAEIVNGAKSAVTNLVPNTIRKYKFW